MEGVTKISKAEWHRLGGLRNPRCFRRQRPDGRWQYFYRQD
jgi:hypothetical protein